MWYRKFYDLDVWKEAKDITLEVYKILESWKIQRDFGLKDQMKRSAISISSNIAEWCGRWWRDQFKYFLKIARGSCSELHSQIIIAQELWVLDHNVDKIIERLEILWKRISAFLKKLSE